jgi:hypothetical protein
MGTPQSQLTSRGTQRHISNIKHLSSFISSPLSVTESKLPVIILAPATNTASSDYRAGVPEPGLNVLYLDTDSDGG